MYSRNKSEIFRRRRANRDKKSSTDTVYRITKIVNPDFSKTIETQEKNLFGKRNPNAIEFKLVVLNPIIKKLLSAKDFRKLLNKIRNDGCKIEEPEIAQRLLETAKTEVKMAYKFLLNDELKGEWPRPVIDSRCPAIIKLVYQEFPHLVKNIAPIDPILITNARRQANMAQENTVIISPCSYFSLFETREINTPSIFLMAIGTWKEFKEKINFHPKQKKLKKSPVPLGFFNDTFFGNLKTCGASGEKDCRKLLKNYPLDAELLELLWCKDGCHNGDGL